MKSIISKLKQFFTFKRKDVVDFEIVKIEKKQVIPKITAVENFHGVLDFLCDDINRSIRLTSYNRKALTTLFGKHTQMFKGDHNYYVWVLKYGEEIFYVFTNNTRGTQFCIVADIDSKKTDVCIGFLNKIAEMLNKLIN
jgi:hypothetical protein